MPADPNTAPGRRRLVRFALEGVAGLELAGLHAGLEPAHALGGGAMGEALRDHVAAGALLEGVVADGAGVAQGFLDVALLQELAGAVGVVGPDAGQAVGL